MNLNPEKKLAKFAGIVIAFLTLVIWAASSGTAHAQTCQGVGPNGKLSVYVGGLQIPNAGNRPDPAFHDQWCMPDDYAQIYRNYFGQYGWLDWVPMANVSYGGFWGRRVPGGYEPVMDAHGQPLSGRQRIERGAGIAILGGAVGRAVGGERGGWIGFATGVGAALINDSRYRGRDKAPAPQPQPTQTSTTSTPPQPSVQIPPSPYPPDYQLPQAGPARYGRQREIKYQVVNPWPVDAVVYYDSNPDETWVARRNSSSLRIPRREGTLMAEVATTANGGFVDEVVVVRGDGKKFIIPDPE